MNTESSMEFSSAAKKAEYNNDHVALARLSFGLPLPIVFGKESNEAELRDSFKNFAWPAEECNKGLGRRLPIYTGQIQVKETNRTCTCFEIMV